MGQAGDQLHLLHVIPTPSPEVLSGTGMGMAGGEFVLAEPDPEADKAQVSLLQHPVVQRACQDLNGRWKWKVWQNILIFN